MSTNQNQPPKPGTTTPDETALERARRLMAQIVYGMTQVATFGAQKAARLAVAASSAAPAQRPTPAGKAAPGPVEAHPGRSRGDSSIFSKALDTFTGKLILILAPLTAFATILNSGASGFKVFLSAINVLAATLAPVLLPVFILLSAAILTAADYLWDAMLPALKDFYSVILIGGINAIETFISWLGKAVVALQDFGDGFAAGFADVFDEMSDGIALGMAKLIDFFTGENIAANLPAPAQGHGLLPLQPGAAQPQAPDAPAANAPPQAQHAHPQLGGFGPKAKENPQRNFLETFKNNVKLSIQEFKFQNMPKASFSGLVQTSRNAQLAALNTSPFEKIVQDRLGKTVTLLEQAVRGIEKLDARGLDN